MPDFAAIQKYSDEELYNELKKHGEDRPVNGNTRRILEKKLANLLGIESDFRLRVDTGRDEFYEAKADDDATSNKNYPGPDVTRRRVRQSIDMTGQAFHVEEMHARPAEILRARRASEAAYMADVVAQLNLERMGEKKGYPQGIKTVWIVLAIFIAIGILMVTYLTRQENAIGDRLA